MGINQQTKIALGSKILLTICSSKNKKTTEEIFKRLWSTIDDFDKQYSRFRPDSQLNKLNNQSGQEIKVSDEFIDLLKISKNLSTKTEGIFNPLILPTLQKSGYKKSWVPNEFTKNPPNYSDRLIGKMSDIKISKNYVSMPKNTALDLGGIGKGYLLDKLGRILSEFKINNYWLSLGGDILAMGQNIDGNPWQIEIDDYKRPNHTIGSIKVATNSPVA